VVNDLDASGNKETNADAAKDAPEKNRSVILVIDDELGIRQLLSLVMTEQGYEVLTAGDGEDGLAIARQRHVDVVISDMKMPKLGGLEVLLALKQLDPSIEVIMLTGFSSIDSALESMKRGAYDYMTKPFQIEDLCRLVARALDKRRLNLELSELQEFGRLKSKIEDSLSREILEPSRLILREVQRLSDDAQGLSAKQREILAKVCGDLKALTLLMQERLEQISNL
jgi:DNA-binding NtrC family response regulator